MKRYNNLFEKVITFENLLDAAYKAQKGKRHQGNVAGFNLQLESELLQLQRELQNKTYTPGTYRAFKIYDPKERLISAAPYRDRVVHHALCNITTPIFEKAFIFDSYANRKGKGTHAAIKRYQYFAKHNKYALKCDIKKFFPSIDLEILKTIFRKKIKCKDTLWLMDLIVDSSNPQEEHIAYFEGDDLFTPQNRRRGLPIGNLTSQWWGNIYMNGLDHFVKETLQVKGYVRYVDDFVLFGDSKQELHQQKKAIVDFLSDYRLVLHPNKTQIHQVKNGVPFLGFRVYAEYCILKKSNFKRFKRYLRKRINQYYQGFISLQDIENGINAWRGHAQFGQSERIEQQVLHLFRNQSLRIVERTVGSWIVFQD